MAREGQRQRPKPFRLPPPVLLALLHLLGFLPQDRGPLEALVHPLLAVLEPIAVELAQGVQLPDLGDLRAELLRSASKACKSVSSACRQAVRA